jgi:hypothetical protein
MKFKAPHLSERQQVLLVIPAVLLALAAVWFLVLAPKFERRREMERLRNQLAKSPYASQSMENLMKIAAHERELGERTKTEWEATVTRLATFAHDEEKTAAPLGRIDYKMELFKARNVLSKRSEELGVQLVPQDLGLRDTLGADMGEVKVRWLQLKTVEKLVDTILSRQVFKLHAIAPLDPLPHNGRDKKLLFTEYPVQVDFEVAFEDLYIFFQSILEDDRVFFIRNIRVIAGTVPGAPLRVEAVVSGVIFE